MAGRRAFSIALSMAAAGAILTPATAAQATFSGDYAASGVYIRTGPHVSSTALGQGFQGQGATILCFTTGDTVNGDPIWWKNTDKATGVTGYSARAYMAGSGPLSHC
jgi:uncharacterized protein YraI